jgi:integrase
MAGKQAKILSVDALDSLLAYASSTRHPVRNTVIVLLSVKAGLRAGEIANLTWSMVLDADGEIGATIALHDKAAKKGSGRSIPMHPQLAEALQAWAGQSVRDGHVITSERGGRMTALSIVIWFQERSQRSA